jgi:hypothetical protein
MDYYQNIVQPYDDNHPRRWNDQNHCQSAQEQYAMCQPFLNLSSPKKDHRFLKANI